jgi:hypothetical protein
MGPVIGRQMIALTPKGLPYAFPQDPTKTRAALRWSKKLCYLIFEHTSPPDQRSS